MAWQKYIKSRCYKRPPMARFWKRGQLGFSVSAVKEYNLLSYRYVILFYDPDEPAVGFQFTNEPLEEGAHCLTHGKTGSQINMKSFCNEYGIDTTASPRLPLNTTETPGFYVICLKPVVDKVVR